VLCDGFWFSAELPIHPNSKQYFVKRKPTINIDLFVINLRIKQTKDRTREKGGKNGGLKLNGCVK
jgi:hypothetical protein